MDPLSLTASIIAILGTGGAIAKGFGKIRETKDAPTVILQLNNDVSDLTLLIRAVDQLLRSHLLAVASPEQEQIVYNALERARNVLLDLEKLVEYTLTKETNLGTQVNRTAWLSSLNRIKEMKTTINATRNELTIVWAALRNKHESSRIELELQEVSFTIDSLQSSFQEQRTILDRTASLATYQTQLLESLQQQLRQSSTPALSEAGQIIKAPMDERAAESPSGGVILDSAPLWSTTIALRLTERCDIGCKCTCHQQKRVRSPSSLSHVFGSLFIGYVGFPSLFSQCGFGNICCEKTEIKGSITYVFPLWFAALAVMINVEQLQRRSPQMLIRCLRVRPFSSTPFQAVAQNQVDHVKSLIVESQASVLDVDEIGRSLLTNTARQIPSPEIIAKNPASLRRCLSMIDILLQEGADVYLEDHFMMSPYRFAWRYCLMNRVAIGTYHTLYSILGKGDPVEAFNFPDLHVATLDLDPSMAFQARLALTPRDLVDKTDATGRTALSWAAELGELNRIEMLLTKGADPNLADISGRSALHWCAPRVDCLAKLLDAGARVDQAEKARGRTKLAALIEQSDSADNVSCVDLLWRNGACLMRPEGSNRAIIHYVVQYYRPNILKWLLGKSIDLEACTEYGTTPILHLLGCDIGKHADMLRMLLDKQPNLHVMDKMEEGLCHYIARYGSLAFLCVLRCQTNLAGLDIDRRSTCGLLLWQKSVPGKTALELAEWRRDHQSAWSLDSSMDPDQDPQAYFTAFNAWIDSIRAMNMARSANTMKANGETSTGDRNGLGTGINSELNIVAEEGLQQRVPGSFPDQ